MLTARLTSIRLRNANLTSIFNALIMRNDRVDWSSVGIVSCHLVSLSIVKFMTFRRWENNKFECRICHQVIKSNLIPDMLQKFYIYNLYLIGKRQMNGICHNLMKMSTILTAPAAPVLQKLQFCLSFVELPQKSILLQKTTSA
ncbi:hypothetical protein T02_8866 [Trichinella nativa]|uniref:Uncharacterized protein n=1 Tax=Trichinella nativa TaxID=6335 RepID=A0A0V1LEI8_9BILA|nr:hypothetical protein T02_8866 [Trichinella nativa]